MKNFDQSEPEGSGGECFHCFLFCKMDGQALVNTIKEAFKNVDALDADAVEVYMDAHHDEGYPANVMLGDLNLNWLAASLLKELHPDQIRDLRDLSECELENGVLPNYSGYSFVYYLG